MIHRFWQPVLLGFPLVGLLAGGVFAGLRYLPQVTADPACPPMVGTVLAQIETGRAAVLMEWREISPPTAQTLAASGDIWDSGKIYKTDWKKLATQQEINIRFGPDYPSLGPLRYATTMETLNIYGDYDWNGYRHDFSALAECRSLKRLTIFNVFLTEADFKAISRIPYLEELTINGDAPGCGVGWRPHSDWDSAITSLRPLRRTPHLRKLDLSFHQHLTDISAIRDLPHLETLTLNGTGVTDLAAVAHHPALKTFNFNLGLPPHSPDFAPLLTCPKLVAVNASHSIAPYSIPVFQQRQVDVNKW